MKREAGVMAYLHECSVFVFFFLQSAELAKKYTVTALGYLGLSSHLQKECLYSLLPQRNKLSKESDSISDTINSPMMDLLNILLFQSYKAYLLNSQYYV